MGSISRPVVPAWCGKSGEHDTAILRRRSSPLRPGAHAVPRVFSAPGRGTSLLANPPLAWWVGIVVPVGVEGSALPILETGAPTASVRELGAVHPSGRANAVRDAARSGVPLGERPDGGAGFVLFGWSAGRAHRDVLVGTRPPCAVGGRTGKRGPITHRHQKGVVYRCYGRKNIPRREPVPLVSGRGLARPRGNVFDAWPGGVRWRAAGGCTWLSGVFPDSGGSRSGHAKVISNSTRAHLSLGVVRGSRRAGRVASRGVT